MSSIGLLRGRLENADLCTSHLFRKCSQGKLENKEEKQDGSGESKASGSAGRVTSANPTLEFVLAVSGQLGFRNSTPISHWPKPAAGLMVTISWALLTLCACGHGGSSSPRWGLWRMPQVGPLEAKTQELEEGQAETLKVGLGGAQTACRSSPPWAPCHSSGPGGAGRSLVSREEEKNKVAEVMKPRALLG